MRKLINILEEVRPEFDFANSNNYVEGGILDSLDIITLVSELDETFSISIDVSDIIPENFNSLDGIKRLIEGYGVTI